MTSSRRKWLVRGVLFAVLWTGFWYREVLEHEFVNWDDPMFITENSRIQGLSLEHFRQWFMTSEAGAYTPLSQLSLALDYALWGLNPVGFHFTNLLFHLANTAVIFVIALKISELVGWGLKPGVIPWGAFFAALLFSTHPLRVESVAWASERRDVLSGLFALLSLSAYLDYLGVWSERKPSRYSYFLALVFFLAAVLSKAVVVTLPLVFLLIDFFLKHRGLDPSGNLSWRQILHCVVEKIPFLAISWGVGWGMMTVLLEGRYALTVRDVGWEPRLAQSLFAGMKYLLHGVLPIHLNPLDRLSEVYDFTQARVWFALGVHGVITALFVGIRSLRWGGLTAWLSYLCILGPFLGIAQSGLQLTADRYTYLPSVPLAIACGMAWEHLIQGRLGGVAQGQVRISILTLAVLYLLGLGVLTFLQVRVWRNSETLWKYVLQTDPQNVVAWNNLGDDLLQKERIPEAIDHFRQAVTLNPRYSDAWFNMGNAYRRNGELNLAVEAYQSLLVYEPTHSGAHHNLALVYVQQTNWALAVSHYQISQKLNPSPSTLYHLARCDEQRGEAALALEGYRKSAMGSFAPAWVGWSDLLKRRGDRMRALEILRKGVKETNDLTVQLAYVELVLSMPEALPVEREQAQTLLLQMDRRTQGQSRKVRNLMEQLRIEVR